jgi:hypothetical protein
MRDLVSLLYRADWTRLRLAAEVTASRDADLDWTRYGADAPPFTGAPRPGQVWEMATDQPVTRTDRSTLLVEPGRRYREQGEDRLSGCDGDQSWFAVRDGDGWRAEAGGEPEPPLPPMLRPSWLLTGFTLEASGPMTTGGREALRVVATPRPGGWSRAPGWSRASGRSRVVDAELGIVLRSVCHAGSRPVSRYELRDVVPGEQGDFRPDIPVGVRVEEEPDDEPPLGPVNTPARVASLIARQAARDARSALKSVLGGLRR